MFSRYHIALRVKQQTVLPAVFFFLLYALLVFHDFLFNYIFYGTAFYYFVAWKEITLGALIFTVIIKFLYGVKWDKYFYWTIFFVCLIFFSYAGSGFHNHANVRFYLYLVLIPYVLAYLLFLFSVEGFIVYRSIFVFCLLPTLLYGYYQYFTISSASDFWYWDHFISLGYEQNLWDAFRGGKPRVSSFYTSSLDYTAYLLLASAVILGFYEEMRVRGKLISAIFYMSLFVLVAHSLYITTVRAGLIGWCCIVILYIYYRLFPISGRFFFWSLTLMVVVVASIFLYIMTGYTSDLSALGRIKQWGVFFELIKDAPLLGAGVTDIGVHGSYWFDSFWLNYFLSFGLVAGFLFIFLLLVGYRSALSWLGGRALPSSNYFALPIYLLVPVFGSLFFFQAFARTPALLVVMMFFFCIYFERGRLARMEAHY